MFDAQQARKEALDAFDRKHGEGLSLYVREIGLILWPDGAWYERGNPDGAQEPDPRTQDSLKLRYAQEKLRRQYEEYRYKFDEARARSNPAVRARWGANAGLPPTAEELLEIEQLRNQVRRTQRTVNRLQAIVDAKYEERRPQLDHLDAQASEAFNKLNDLRL